MASYLCNRCKKEFQFEQVAYGADQRVYCLECLKAAKAEEKKPKQPQTKGKMRVRCNHCNYAFQIKVPSDIKPTCPYCGRSDLRRDNLTAEALLEEADREN